MSRPLNTYDKISIAEIIIYTVFLFGGVFLCIKHGLNRSAGWSFLIILAVARLIGASLELATINDPSNASLYTGWLTLNGVGLGPLILMLLGLLSRLFDSINRQGHVVVQPLYLRLIQLLMLVGMILLIVGGTNSDYQENDGIPKITYTGESKAGISLMVVVVALLIVETCIIFRNQGYVSQGEHRILVAVVACIPFVIVRLVYACVLILGDTTQSVWMYLGAGVIMEMVVVLICEIVGFSLDKAPPKPQEPSQMEMKPTGSNTGSNV